MASVFCPPFHHNSNRFVHFHWQMPPSILSSNLSEDFVPVILLNMSSSDLHQWPRLTSIPPGLPTASHTIVHSPPLTLLAFNFYDARVLVFLLASCSFSHPTPFSAFSFLSLYFRMPQRSVLSLNGLSKSHDSKHFQFASVSDLCIFNQTTLVHFECQIAISASLLGCLIHSWSFPCLWSGYSRWLFSCPLFIACPTTACFTYIYSENWPSYMLAQSPSCWLIL